MGLGRRLPYGYRSSSRRRQGPCRDRACRPGQDHGAAYLSPPCSRNSGLRRRNSGAAMKLPRIVRQIGKRVVKASPILRRHIMSSSDHRVLGGVEEARSATASSGGWLAARTVARQERAYRGLIADMKRGEPRIDFSVPAEALAPTPITHPPLLHFASPTAFFFSDFPPL